ncbi:portal protein [Shimia sp.]|uniref:portal protein n=1 Tax=Shimia sp. TaxID=1954381 RepID=UPI003BA879B8
MSTQARYTQLSSSREPFLTRARENSTLTIPSLIPPEGHSGSSPLKQPYQSVGARGSIGLTAKATTTLMPPNEPFFRLDIEEFTLAEISQNPEARAEIEQALTMVERTASRSVEASGTRMGFSEATQHLIIGGNALVYVQEDLNLKVYGLQNFVVARDPSGNAVEIITEEEVNVATLSPEVAALVKTPTDKNAEGAMMAPEQTAKLYTHLVREDKLWMVKQSVNDVDIPGTEGSYPLDKCPWFPLRWTRIDGEDYGRSHVETIIGDLKSLENLTKAILEYAAGAAKVIALVNPNGVTDEEDLSNAENFEFVAGVESDVSFLRIDKYADLQVAKNLADDLTRRIEQHFLMNSSIQRQGERVTAEEIRYMAADLEATIGAVYVQLSQEFQLPLVKITIEKLVKQKRLPKLPKELVQPTVTTGIDALSRQSDLNKLDRMVAGLRDLYGPEALSQETNVADYVKRRAAALGIDPTGLLKTEEQKAQEAEQRLNQQMMLNGAGQMINQMGGIAQKGMETQDG